MYKHLDPNHYRSNYNLASDYVVDAVLIYGGHNLSKYIEYLKTALQNLNLEYSFEEPFDKSLFIRDIVSLKINNKRIWFFAEYGGTKLSEFLHFGCMFGSKINILLGACGGLKKGLVSGNVIVPEWSYSTDSSAFMFTRPKDYKYYSDLALSKKIIENLNKAGVQTYTGSSITCQAMTAETQEDVINWSNQGYTCVEMESATVFAVSQAMNVPSAAILQIADNLIEGEYVHSESYKSTKEMRSANRIKMFECALNELKF